jgi:hypothetical protein
MPTDELKTRNKTSFLSSPSSPLAEDSDTPEEVLRYLDLREQREVVDAALKELEPLVIRWGEKQIRECRLTSKTLPIPELEAKGKQLSITEKKTHDKNNPELVLLDEMIDEQKAIAARKNKKEINRLMSEIGKLQEALQRVTITPRGFDLTRKKDELLERITYRAKGLMVRNIKGKSDR